MAANWLKADMPGLLRKYFTTYFDPAIYWYMKIILFRAGVYWVIEKEGLYM